MSTLSEVINQNQYHQNQRNSLHFNGGPGSGPHPSSTTKQSSRKLDSKTGELAQAIKDHVDTMTSRYGNTDQTRAKVKELSEKMQSAVDEHEKNLRADAKAAGTEPAPDDTLKQASAMRALAHSL